MINDDASLGRDIPYTSDRSDSFGGGPEPGDFSIGEESGEAASWRELKNFPYRSPRDTVGDRDSASKEKTAVESLGSDVQSSAAVAATVSSSGWPVAWPRTVTIVFGVLPGQNALLLLAPAPVEGRWGASASTSILCVCRCVYMYKCTNV